MQLIFRSIYSWPRQNDALRSKISAYNLFPDFTLSIFFLVILFSCHLCHLVSRSNHQVVKRAFNFIKLSISSTVILSPSVKTLYILCLGVAIAMGLKTIQSYLIALALPAGLQFAKPNSLSEWNSMIPRISIKSTKQSAHQTHQAICIILKITSGFPTPTKMGFRNCPF